MDLAQPRAKSDRLFLSGGTLIDGTGESGRHGNLLIEGERIVEADDFETPLDAIPIDCTGLVVAPGFIDGHSHSDLQVLEKFPEKVAQGVTTEIVGNCGFSAYPSPQKNKDLIDFANGIFCGGENWGWSSAKDYLEAARSAPFVNVCSLVGHGSLRIWLAGQAQRTLSRQELDLIAHRLAEELEAGACGFSTGLMYAPGSSAPAEELESLCDVAARHDKIYATHMRDYGFRLVEAVDEQIHLARKTGCRLQISHFQAVGARNWALQQVALEKIEKARQEGMDVGFDCYPYLRGSTVLTQLLPQWALDGGVSAMLERLSDDPLRTKIAAQTDAELAQGWGNILISSVDSKDNAALVGKSIAEIARISGQEPVTAALDLLLQESGRVNILEINQCEANLKQTLTHPLANIISDGFYVKAKPHPRLHGTFPFFLGEISRKQGWLSLPEAIHKITGLPARRFGIQERGTLARGNFADITIFDPLAIGSPANYDSPDLAPVGIRYVFRSGQLVFGEKTISAQ